MCLAIYENIVSHKKKCIYKKRQTWGLIPGGMGTGVLLIIEPHMV
jgi:hypothetical protein